MNLIEKIYQKALNTENGYIEFDDLGFSDGFIDIEETNGATVTHKMLPLSSFWENYKDFSENVELIHTYDTTPSNPKSRIWIDAGNGSSYYANLWKNPPYPQQNASNSAEDNDNS